MTDREEEGDLYSRYVTPEGTQTNIYTGMVVLLKGQVSFLNHKRFAWYLFEGKEVHVVVRLRGVFVVRVAL